MSLHPCVSLNNENIGHEISEHVIEVCEKTAGIQSGKSFDLDSASSNVLELSSYREF